MTKSAIQKINESTDEVYFADEAVDVSRQEAFLGIRLCRTESYRELQKFQPTRQISGPSLRLARTHTKGK